MRQNLSSGIHVYAIIIIKDDALLHTSEIQPMQYTVYTFLGHVTLTFDLVAPNSKRSVTSLTVTNIGSLR